MPADEDGKGVERRQFLKRAAITGAAVWSVPVISTLSASPAFAQTGSHPVETTTTEPETTTTTQPGTTTTTQPGTTTTTQPGTTTTTTTPPGFCGHSVGGPDDEGCMGACTGAGCNGTQCNGFGTGDFSPCDIGCPQAGNDNPCCNPGLCDSGNFQCDPGDADASYCGPTVNCDGVAFVTSGCN